MIGHRRARSSDDRRERGAALVEFAIVVPVVVVLVFGALEFGFQWRFAHGAVGVTRAGARVGAGLGVDPQTDYQILTTIRTSLESTGQFDQVVRVVVYEANSATGRPPASCMRDVSPTGECNVFNKSMINGTLTTAMFHATTGCYTGSTANAPLKAWCPDERVTDQRIADYIGVAVVLRSGSITGLYPRFTVVRDTVMRMEP